MNDKSSTSLIQLLSQTSAGLVFQSEADYPYEVVYWQANTDETLNADFICHKTGISEGTQTS